MVLPALTGALRTIVIMSNIGFEQEWTVAMGFIGGMPPPPHRLMTLVGPLLTHTPPRMVLPVGADGRGEREPPERIVLEWTPAFRISAHAGDGADRGPYFRVCARPVSMPM